MTSININITLHPFLNFIENYNMSYRQLMKVQTLLKHYSEENVIENDSYKGLRYLIPVDIGYDERYLVIEKNPNFQFYDDRFQDLNEDIQYFINCQTKDLKIIFDRINNLIYNDLDFDFDEQLDVSFICEEEEDFNLILIWFGGYNDANFGEFHRGILINTKKGIMYKDKDRNFIVDPNLLHIRKGINWNKYIFGDFDDWNTGNMAWLIKYPILERLSKEEFWKLM